jgi:hypothetical protein
MQLNLRLLRQGTAKGKRAVLWGAGRFDIPMGVTDDETRAISASNKGHVAEWLRTGLQNRARRFNSGRGLHISSDQFDGAARPTTHVCIRAHFSAGAANGGIIEARAE